MPRASEFRHAASTFGAMAESLSDEAASRRFLFAGLIGLIGPAADVVDVRLRAATEHLTLASDGYRDLARECERRADICDDYAARVRRYWSLSTIERLQQAFPQRPAPWADA